MARVADQHGFGGQHVHPRDLADHPQGIDHGLAFENVVPIPLVDGHAMPVRVQVYLQDLGDHDPVGDLGGRVHEGAQAGVLGFQGRHALQPGLVNQDVRPQDPVFREQPAAFRQALGGPGCGREGQVHDDPDRVDRHGKALADGPQVTLLVIENHQEDGEYRDQKHADSQRGATHEERFGVCGL